jgi:hypothetical protein
MAKNERKSRRLRNRATAMIPRHFFLDFLLLGWSWYHWVPRERSSVSMTCDSGTRTRQVVAEVLVLVEHGHHQFLGDVADEEAELLVPGGGQAALHDGRLGAALAQLELHEGVAGAVEVHGGEAPRLHHAH